MMGRTQSFELPGITERREKKSHDQPPALIEGVERTDAVILNPGDWQVVRLGLGDRSRMCLQLSRWNRECAKM